MRIFVATLPFFFFSNLAASSLLLEHSPQPLQAESKPEALVPWETPVEGFFIRTHHPVPAIDTSRWRLVIDGLVEKPLALSLADLQKLKMTSLHAVLECSGNGRGLQTPGVAGILWSRGAVGNAEWTGVQLAQILKKAGVKPSAKFATIQGADLPAMRTVPPFVRSVPIEKLLKDDSLVALKMNREPLPLLHGGPARLILPGWYAENWIKWVTRITLTDQEDPGFYMKKAYRMPRSPVRPGEAWDSAMGMGIEEIRVQSFITQPIGQSQIQPGSVHVRGKTFSGAGAIEKVEISSDKGKTWQLAQVSPQRRTGGWQEFELELVMDKSGKQTLWSKATDFRGNTQPIEHLWNPGGYLRNAVDVVTFTVSVIASEARQSILHKTSENLDCHAPLAMTKRKHSDLVLESRCLACHAKELITSQRLTGPQWDGVLNKMDAFGVKLESAERDLLKTHLSTLSPAVPKSPLGSLDYRQESELMRTPHGNSKHGQATYAKNCAVCHGAQGEGQLAPRLIGRAFSMPTFISTIRDGKGMMPPFKATLTQQDIHDLNVWLHTSR